MASNSILQLNQNFIQNGLGTLTFTVPATILNGPAVLNTIFAVSCQTTVQSALGTDTGAGSAIPGHGAGAGGGDIDGFAAGGSGLGLGAKGQGFGPVPNNYTQPLAYVTRPVLNTPVSSALSIVVKQNGTTVYTAPTLTPTQSSLQFTTQLLCTAGDVITVVFASSNASDNTLNGIQSNVSIFAGE